MSNRPEIAAALERAGNDDNLRRAADDLSPALHGEEVVLEIAASAADESRGAAFVTDRRLIVQKDGAGNAEFEFLDLDGLSNVFAREYPGGWSLVAEAFAVWKVWGGFGPRAAQRLAYASRWALTAGREARLDVSRDASSSELFAQWRAALAAEDRSHLKETLRESRWFI